MANILILFAHPRLEKSRINAALIDVINEMEQVTFRDLYELYPNFNIDIEAEKQALQAHDIIIWMHPFYWYSSPPLLKQWIDMVLELGWAYGPGGTALQGKWIFNAITTGGTQEVYQEGARNRFTIQQFLAPFDQTVHLCKMEYLSPFAIQGTHRLNDSEVIEKVNQFKLVLAGLTAKKWTLDELKSATFLQDLLV